jgi:hypothetical protein
MSISFTQSFGGQRSTSHEPADLLGRRDTWPPVWKDKEQHDPSAANGSSIMLLAEFGNHALLLAGDGHAPDLATALERLSSERHPASAPPPVPLAAFKLPHHASEKNLSRAVLETVDCTRYLISTDGSGHGHPDHQALLRILRYSRRTPPTALQLRHEDNATLARLEIGHSRNGFPGLFDPISSQPGGQLYS